VRLRAPATKSIIAGPDNKTPSLGATSYCGIDPIVRRYDDFDEFEDLLQGRDLRPAELVVESVDEVEDIHPVWSEHVTNVSSHLAGREVPRHCHAAKCVAHHDVVRVGLDVANREAGVSNLHLELLTDLKPESRLNNVDQFTVDLEHHARGAWSLCS
jgi:hypothetical protein